MKNETKILKNASSEEHKRWHMGRIEIKLSMISGLLFLVQAIVIAAVGLFLFSASFFGGDILLKDTYESNIWQSAAMFFVFSLAMGGPGFWFFLKPVHKQ